MLEKYESQLSCSNSGYNELKQQVDTLTTELGKYKKLCFEIEAERDRHERDCERSQRIVQEREKLLEKVNLDLLNVKEQFEDYRRKADSELDCAKQTNHNMDHLAVELERNRNKIQEINSENQFLQQENHNLSAKVEELKEDIEGKLSRLEGELFEKELFYCFSSGYIFTPFWFSICFVFFVLLFFIFVLFYLALVLFQHEHGCHYFRFYFFFGFLVLAFLVSLIWRFGCVAQQQQSALMFFMIFILA